MNAPDFIAAEQGWRTWKLTGGGLLNSVSYATTWEPGTPIAAQCKTSQKKWAWDAVPMAEAIESKALMAQDWTEEYDADAGRTAPRPPRVVLPFTHSYVYRETPHHSPDESCTCGIYAAHSPDQCAGYGKYVLGRVNLWGRVIPGDKGYRAEFAYPSELFVLSEPIPENLMSYNHLLFLFTQRPEEKPLTDKQVAGLRVYDVPVRRVATWGDAVAAVETVAA